MAQERNPADRGEGPPHDNALSPEFLALLEQLDDEAPGMNEAMWGGEWEPRFLGAGRWGVFRSWEEPGIHSPAMTFASHERALLAAAVLPGIGRSDLFHLDPDEAEGGGFPLIAIEGGPRQVGVLPIFHPELVTALVTAELLTRSPRSLAMVIQASGSDAIKLSGAVLRGRIAAQATEQEADLDAASAAEPE